MQATYVRAYYHLREFRGPDGLRSWLGPHYDSFQALGLTEDDKWDLVEYLKSV